MKIHPHNNIDDDDDDLRSPTFLNVAWEDTMPTRCESSPPETDMDCHTF